MSLMLVAYDKCGCRVSALPTGKQDAVAAEEFVAEMRAGGFMIREEEHEAIGAQRCESHRGVPRKGSR